jgi:hypothetical protein
MYTDIMQEISTEGYPTDDTRALLVVDGFNVSTAVRATDSNLSGVKLRNVQVCLLAAVQARRLSIRSMGIVAVPIYTKEAEPTSNSAGPIQDN